MTIEEETQEQKMKSLWLEYIWLNFSHVQKKKMFSKRAFLVERSGWYDMTFDLKYIFSYWYCT